jgi:hypothetical protein
MTAPHDRPTAAELVEAVREFLERDVLPATEGRVQFHTRVSVRVLSMVERELAAGDRLTAVHQMRLEQLGVESDEELADAIRSGGLDEQAEAVRRAVMDSVIDKLRVANPDYLEEGDR